LIGFAAAANHIDLSAVLLFLIVAFWQMPHFFAIALFRLPDYTRAGIPVLPVVKGIHATKVQKLIYTALFLIAATSLTWLGYAGKSYGVVALLMGGFWLWLARQGFRADNDTLWARRMFAHSLIAIVALFTALAIDPWL
jgi:protoheme IX farnesyltransferase